MCLGENNGACFIALLSNDHTNTRFDDSGLFRRDFRQRVAEKVFMIKIDTRNNACFGNDDVCCIQPAAKSGFENCNLCASFSEVSESNRGDAFKKGGMSA